jgi:tetratricopeptide (TPR) repeat protein
VVLSASVRGMGGIGKTTLALAAGHAALAGKVFTGAVFVDLRGYDDAPVDAGHALDSMLRQLGVAAGQIPPDIDQRATLYRAQLAARTRRDERVLVIADNASHPKQVEPLVPGEGPHRLLVTSRDDLSSIGARLVDLDVLPPGQAVDVLEAAVRTALPKDGRVGADPEGARRVAELCGYLPLALRIAAAQLIGDRALRPAQLAEELGDPVERLDVLTDGGRAVRGVLERSVRRLTPPQAELFRLLAANPGPDLALEAAVALGGVGRAKDVRGRLVALARASLLRQDPDTARWSMHDLVRAYATEQALARPVQHAEAQRRVLEYYTRAAMDAAAHLNPAVGGDMARFVDRAGAMQWLDTEQANLVAAVHTARSSDCLDVTAWLAFLLTDYLTSRRLLPEALAVTIIALVASRLLGRRDGEANAWTNLGNALRELRRYDEALNAHHTALNTYQDLNDHHGQAEAWNILGAALRGRGEFDAAVEAGERAVALFTEVGDEYGRGEALDELAQSLSAAGRPGGDAREAAAEAYRTAGAEDEAARVLAQGKL